MPSELRHFPAEKPKMARPALDSKQLAGRGLTVLSATRPSCRQTPEAVRRQQWEQRKTGTRMRENGSLDCRGGSGGVEKWSHLECIRNAFYAIIV